MMQDSNYPTNYTIGRIELSNFPDMSTGIVHATQGWQCPVCKGIYAPTVPGCMKCNKPDMRGVAG